MSNEKSKINDTFKNSKNMKSKRLHLIYVACNTRKNITCITC